MPDYTTFDDLRSINREMLSEERTRIVKASVERSPNGSTFLSHSTKDTELLPAVIKVLESQGATVYTDKKDSALPDFTNRETAKILRERVKQCSKFVLFATDNSKDSRWMPWELGLSDGYKGANRVAVFPANENAKDTRWSEREYLGVYDRIVWGRIEGEGKDKWLVWNQEENTGCSLSDWLRR